MQSKKGGLKVVTESAIGENKTGLDVYENQDGEK